MEEGVGARVPRQAVAQRASFVPRCGTAAAERLLTRKQMRFAAEDSRLYT
jgi:hypothetical protein